MRNVIVVVASLMVFSSIASGEVLTVKMNCKNGKCTPVSQDVKTTMSPAEIAKVKALLKKAQELKARLNDVDKADSARFETLTGRVMPEVAKALTEARELAEKNKAKTDELEKKVSAQNLTLAQFRTVVSLLSHHLDKLDGENAILKARKVNFEVGFFGAFTHPFGTEVGLLLGISLPMGETGLWNTRFSGGGGLSPSNSFGWATKLSVTRTFGNSKLFSFGPSVIALGDQGNIFNGSEGWIVGGGAELRVTFKNRFFIEATPFVGLAGIKERQDIWTPAVYKPSTCSICGGVVLAEPGHWTETEPEWKLELGYGALLSAGFKLF